MSVILFEDAHLLVIDKPAGINTHKPDRFTQDGIHEWLKKQEPRWRDLAIHHRLDKETSGVMLFGKTRQANQSLTAQFEAQEVEKEYLLLVAGKPTRAKFMAQSKQAVTNFEYLQPHGALYLLAARPITGKTHQIRRHAAENSFPICGDTLYGGPSAPRLMLHARSIQFNHPQTGEPVRFAASVPDVFETMDPLDVARAFREPFFSADPATIDPAAMAPHRLISGAADGFADVIVDRFGEAMLVQWHRRFDETVCGEWIERLRAYFRPNWLWEQTVTLDSRTPPVCVDAPPAEPVVVVEHGLRYRLRFEEAGFSVGLFPDQRENRRRLLSEKLTGKRVLNCFAYTCSFSVAAARAGAQVTSVDLSRTYLDWGKENFQLNDLDPAVHDFIHGDVFQWLKQFAKRDQRWDLVMLDPPTFSTTKTGPAFRADRNYGELVTRATPLVSPRGTLFCSTNQRTFDAEKFEATVRDAIESAGRAVESITFETQPFDFRVAEREKPYLKTLWFKLAD